MNTYKLNIDDFIVTSCNNNIAGSLILQSLRKKRKTIITHFNLYNYTHLTRNKGIHNRIENTSALLFEGIGMKIFLFLLGQGILPDTNGTDLFPIVMRHIQNNHHSVFLLGGRPSVIQKAYQQVTHDYPSINFSGYNNGYYYEAEESDIVNTINNSRSDLLICGMGIKREMEFLYNNFDELEVGTIWNVGGLFDFLSGAKSRAPKFMRCLRLEWLHRFILEPRKKYKRIFHTPVIALQSLIKQHHNLRIISYE